MAKEKENNPAVKADMLIGDIIEKYPEAAKVMFNYGLHCIGCRISTQESLKQGAMAHGLSTEKINQMVTEINQAIGEK
jgi:hybrid cluster-associated redox disulfide protein